MRHFPPRLSGENYYTGTERMPIWCVALGVVEYFHSRMCDQSTAVARKVPEIWPIALLSGGCLPRAGDFS
ncbi:hypothetical protein T492DRAFT_1028960 [Pavlovales sp. CCMP2436]|nr:hypothetical protein T492DRAFT_1028960 [Pavlovales sp. CCMP2436]